MSMTTTSPVGGSFPEAYRDIPQVAVTQLGQTALTQHEIEAVFDMAVELVCHVLDVEYAKVLRRSSAGEPLLLVAGCGWQEHVEVGNTTVPDDSGSQAGFTLLSNGPVVVEDLASEERFAGPQLLIDHAVVSGISVAIPGRERPFGVVGAHTRFPRRFTSEEANFLQSVAYILGSAVENHRVRAQIERRAGYETALSDCAQALLASTGQDRLELALEALLTATQATYVFVERNVMDPELGFCSQTVAEVEQEGAPDYEDSDYWELVPWDHMPTSRAHLEQGNPFMLIPEMLEGVEFELYAADPIPVKSELDIPIFVDGEWAGLIGFADMIIVRHWTDNDLSLLATAAKMIGAFWERDAANTRLEEMNLAKDEFLASISHELRTPLTSVMGYAQLLRDSDDRLTEPQRHEAAAAVLKQAGDLNQIVGDLLVAAKAEMGELTVNRVPVNLFAQASQVLEEYRGQKQVSDIRLRGSAPRASGDPTRVRQIFRNLMTNALRYGGESIRMEFLDIDHRAVARVIDNGQGVAPEDRERIFLPRQRSSTAPGLTAALGLGLTISHQLAQLMGGDLTYRYVEGESIFEFSLPVLN